VNRFHCAARRGNQRQFFFAIDHLATCERVKGIEPAPEISLSPPVEHDTDSKASSRMSTEHPPNRNPNIPSRASYFITSDRAMSSDRSRSGNSLNRSSRPRCFSASERCLALGEIQRINGVITEQCEDNGEGWDSTC
jgi:hypothetical protein